MEKKSFKKKKERERGKKVCEKRFVGN